MRLALALALCTACETPPPQPSLPPGPKGTEVWKASRDELRTLRDRFDPGRPYSLNVTLELWVERLGMRTRGRGAVAIHPPDAVRMILLGPGGTTAMDLWICRDAFRFAVPAADLIRRGDRHTPDEELRGLPVGFLRWWFLEPLGGKLLAAWERGDEHQFVLRDDDGVVRLSAGREDRDLRPLAVTRLSPGDEESLEVDGRLCGRVHYHQRSTSIDIEVDCEKLNDKVPPARAFADPDRPERPCIGEVDS